VNKLKKAKRKVVKSSNANIKKAKHLKNRVENWCPKIK
jgi:hypothetical protein